eukprot:11149866-Karenia_brevis.AAC.1
MEASQMSMTDALAEEEAAMQGAWGLAGASGDARGVSDSAEAFPADEVPYKVHQNPQTASLDDLYTDLEKVPFPEEKVKSLLGDEAAKTVDNFQ